MSEPFDGARFRELSAGLGLGHPLTTTLRTGSTNDDALAAARVGAPHGALFVTEEQHQGRGRRGSSWLAAPGAGLLFSLVIRPRLAPDRAPALALVAGLAVRSAVAERLAIAAVPHAARVKWPNDVVVGGKKLAGILVESQVRGGELGAVVVGVGLNVGRVKLPSELQAMTTSLYELGASVSREELLARVLRAFEERLGALESSEMPLKSLVDELRSVDALAGRKLSVGEVEGIASGIDAKGFLEVVDARGFTHRVGSGHVVLAD